MSAAKPGKAGGSFIVDGGICACGKKRWLSKADAKTVRRRAHPGQIMRVYQCGDAWHYGHVNTTAMEDR